MSRNVGKIEEKCRICTDTAEYLIDTWMEEFNHIHEKLQAVINSEENYTNWLRFICIYCKQQLDNLWNFRIQCKNAYRLFLDEMENERNDQQNYGEKNKGGNLGKIGNEEARKDCFGEVFETVLVKMDVSERNDLVVLEEVEISEISDKQEEDLISERRKLRNGVGKSNILRRERKKRISRREIIKCVEKAPIAEEVQSERLIQSIEDTTRSQNERRKRTRTYNLPCTCAICHKKLSSKNNLRGHIRRKHLNLRPYLCESCGYKCYTKYALNQHELIHAENPSRFPCNLCDKTFTREMNMKRHLQIHLNPSQKRQNTRQCKICSEKFKTKEIFLKHMESHSEITIDGRVLRGSRRKVCSYCPKEFKLPAQLIIHERSHTGERPFVCEICSKAFRQKCHLNTHMIVHTGEKSHKCPHCEKIFTSKGTLTVHIRIHTGETPYKCPTCPRRFHELKMCKNHSKKCSQGYENETTIETQRNC